MDSFEQFRNQYEQQQQFKNSKTYEELLREMFKGLKDEDWRPIYDQCIKDAEEYFTELNIDILSKQARQTLNKEQKERVFAFLKSRKEYYSEYGLLIS